MNKKKLLIVMGLATCAGCFAQDNITINLASGKKTYKVDDIKSMTFEGNSLKVNKQTDEADTYLFADITSISFNTTDGVKDLKIEGGKLAINVKPGSSIIEINGYDSKERYSVAVFNLAGEKVLDNKAWKGEPVDISALPQGVYVFKINNTTLKFRK